MNEQIKINKHIHIEIKLFVFIKETFGLMN